MTWAQPTVAVSGADGYEDAWKVVHVQNSDPPNDSVSDSENIFPKQLSPEVLQAMKSVRFIAQHIKDADKDNEVRLRCT